MLFRKTSKKFWLRKFSVWVILDTYLLYREHPLTSLCCKGEACLPRSHYQGRGSLESKIVYRGVGADFEKQTKKFSANNEQGSIKRGEKWFSEKLRKNLDLENFRSKSFLIRTSRIDSSRFRARVAKGTGRHAFRDRITSGSLESPPPPGINITYACSIGKKPNLITNSSFSITLCHVLLLLWSSFGS